MPMALEHDPSHSRKSALFAVFLVCRAMTGADSARNAGQRAQEREQWGLRSVKAGATATS